MVCLGCCRAGFYAENLLLYSEQARNEGLLPLPIGENHKFAPIALGVSRHIPDIVMSLRSDIVRTSLLWPPTFLPERARTVLTTGIVAS